MAKSPLLAISVLNWNGWQDTLECLRSIRALDYPHYSREHFCVACSMVIVVYVVSGSFTIRPRLGLTTGLRTRVPKEKG